MFPASFALLQLLAAILDRRVLAATASGLLLTAAFPNIGVAGFAWVAPGLLLLSAAGTTGGNSFRLGYIAGLVHFLSSLYWLLYIPFPGGALAGWLALSAFIALYPALWVWGCWKLFPARSIETSPNPDVPRWVASWGHVAWWQRSGWAVFCAAAWVAMEMIRARLLSGFPWNPLGSSQFRQIPIIQIASITGVYGLSFLPVWFAVSLANTVAMFLHKQTAHRSWSGEIILPLVVALVVAGLGLKTVLTPPPASDRTLKIALVQPSIPQNLIFDPAETTNRFRKLIELSIKALESKPDLLIWPEAALPGFSEENVQAITNLVARHQVWMILGADDAVMRPNASDTGNYDFYNSAFLFSPEGRFVATYRKQRLVIFGEYLPFGDTFPILRRILPIPGDFTAGKGPVPFRLREPKATIAPVICFEDVFPHYVRGHVEDDTDFLLNLTNDGWFGESAAQWQQAATALFRAVENGVPLIRCTNNGLTCWIDERGRLRDWLGRESGQVYAPGFITVEIPLRPADGIRSPTFYRQHGDVFGWGCVGWTTLVAGLRFLKRRSGNVSGESRS